MIDVTAIQAEYPNPRMEQENDGSDVSYCVGGAFLLYAGKGRWKGKVDMDTQSMSRQLSEKTWDWCDDNAIGDILIWLQQLGCHIVSRPELGYTWIIKGVTGTRVELCRGQESVAVAHAMGVLCGGTQWAQLFPDFLTLVHAEQVRRQKGKNETEN